jgi:hypothetical protein
MTTDPARVPVTVLLCPASSRATAKMIAYGYHEGGERGKEDKKLKL